MKLKFPEERISSTESFNPIIGKPHNIDKVTLQQIDNLNITYIFTTGRSASTLLGVMLMMHENVVTSMEEVFPVILKQKYYHIKKWTDDIIKNYCDDFVLMSEGKLYPLFCGKDILYELLIRFKEHLNYERVIKISYLAFGVNKDLSKITTIVDKQLRYYLTEHYLNLFPSAKILLLIRDPRDNVYSKYNRAARKGITPQPCIYIHTWLEAYLKYYKLFKKYRSSYTIVNYENLINNSQDIMQKICNYLSIPYSEKLFEYPQLVNQFINGINHPVIKKHFSITHKSLTQPIMPQKVNEWKNEMNNKDIQNIINATWYKTKLLAEKFNYTEHENYNPKNIYCLITYIKVKYTQITSFIYFSFLPYFIKKYIKKLKHPYRLHANTTFDIFSRQSYL